MVAVGSALGSLVACGVGTTTTNVAQPPPVASAANISSPANSIGAVESTAAPDNWTYSVEKDEMTDRKTYLACTTSTNEVDLSAPYQPVTAKLCIRQSPKYGFDVFVALNGDGQFMCQSFESCRINVRFGSRPQERWSAIGPADNSTNAIFLHSQKRAFAGIKDADTTLVEATFYDNGDQTMDFDTKGLIWPPKG